MVPFAIKIIISAYTNPSEIINAINQSRAYMYLVKPIDTVQLIQILRNAFDTYNLILRNNQLIEALKQIGITDPKSLSKIRKSNDYENTTEEFIHSFRKLFALSEKYYFTNHTSYVLAITEALAKEIKLTDKVIFETITAASFINIPYILMPKRFYLYDPFDLDQNDKLLFFNIFKEAINILSKIKAIETQVQILSQIWENLIGTGGPYGLQGSEVLRESRVIAMANI